MDTGLNVRTMFYNVKSALYRENQSDPFSRRHYPAINSDHVDLKIKQDYADPHRLGGALRHMCTKDTLWISYGFVRYR